MMKMVHKKANFFQHWVPTRHGNFYNWIMFGLRQLPNNYSSYTPAPPLKIIELDRWIPKTLSLEFFTSKQLLHIKRKLSVEEPTWKYYYKSLTSNNKDLHISPFTFYPKFEIYNGVRNIKHQQLFEGDLSSIYRFTGNRTKIISKEKSNTDWLLYHDSYTRRSRDSRFTFGKTVLSTRVWTDTNTGKNNFIFNHKRSINPILMTSN